MNPFNIKNTTIDMNKATCKFTLRLQDVQACCLRLDELD